MNNPTIAANTNKSYEVINIPPKIITDLKRLAELTALNGRDYNDMQEYESGEAAALRRQMVELFLPIVKMLESAGAISVSVNSGIEHQGSTPHLWSVTYPRDWRIADSGDDTRIHFECDVVTKSGWREPFDTRFERECHDDETPVES